MSIANIEKRQSEELARLEEDIKVMLKGLKKKAKAEAEARAIQMRFDMKAKHRDEMEELEEQLECQEDASGVVNKDSCSATVETPTDDTEKLIAAKKAKAKRKQDKRTAKEAERQMQRQQLLEEAEKAGPSLKEIELQKINQQLAAESFIVRPVLSDGNCLYRAIADQLRFTTIDSIESNGENVSGGDATYTHMQLRKLAAEYMMQHPEEFCPFLGFPTPPISTEFEEYCGKVASETLGEWGGQIELKALSAVLRRTIIVYSADAPVVEMNSNDSSVGVPPIRITYHKHYYALGEHYNSITSL